MIKGTGVAAFLAAVLVAAAPRTGAASIRADSTASGGGCTLWESSPNYIVYFCDWDGDGANDCFTIYTRDNGGPWVRHANSTCGS